MSNLAILKDAWMNRDKLGDGGRSRELSAFLPAALEIQETPPNPLSRWVSRILLVLFSLGVLWTYFGEVNIVASAEGKIIPSSRVKQVQPLEKGIVKSILVSEGTYVTKGQALVELDTTLTASDENRLSFDLKSAEQKLIVNKALFSFIQKAEKNNKSIKFSDLDLSGKLNSKVNSPTFYKQLLWQKWQEYWSQKLTFKSMLEKTYAEQLAAKDIIVKLEQTLPIINKKTEKLKQLYSKAFVSETNYLDAEQERIQQTQDLEAEKHRYQQLIAQANQIRGQNNNHVAQTSSILLSEMTDQQRQISTLKEELIKVSDINDKRILYAPVSGRIQELAINTVGGVVTEAQQLMLIVPDEEQLEVEVTLENKDIGFVRADMPAEIKVHTFPFTKYGTINGQVTNVSNDAIVDEKRGLIYTMQLRMDDNKINVEGNNVRLIAGMAVTAEVHIGKRRIIEFFLAPLLRYKNESIRER